MIKKRLFTIFWLLLVVLLGYISFTYKSRNQSLMAVVESQETAISYQKPVVIEEIRVIPGQKISPGDTLLKVSRPDLTLDMDKKKTELSSIETRISLEQKRFKSELARLQEKLNKDKEALALEKAELRLDLAEQGLVSGAFRTGETPTISDSLRKARLELLDQQLQQLSRYHRQEISYLKQIMDETTGQLGAERMLLSKELEVLASEYETLYKLAKAPGIVGTLSVQLDELVPPFKTVMSIYEESPSVIKAYMNERFSAKIQPGVHVKVISENRLYEVEGVVMELGARITSYPDKLQGVSGSVFYGQEIFISIPTDNRFLNGEKVFVYPRSNEE